MSKMSSGNKSLSRENSKKVNERISEDFYARMESDVKSLVKKIRPGRSTTDNEDNEPESSLFSPAIKYDDMKGKKRKHSDNSASTNRTMKHDDEDEQDRQKCSKKVKSSSSSSFSQNSVPRSSSSTQQSKPPATKASATSENTTSHHYANEKTVYVSGLPFSCTEEDIRTFFKDVGTIKSVRLPRWHDSGKLRGYGHVEFATKAAADAAMDLSGQYIGDRFVNVDRPMVPRAAQALPGTTSISADATAAATAVARPHPPGCRTIFIKNLPYDVTEDEVRQHFMVYGPIMNIRLAGWNHTNNLKGFGYVEYKREDSTEIAVKKNGTVLIRDRRIVVDYDTAAPKGSYRNPTKDITKK